MQLTYGCLLLAGCSFCWGQERASPVDVTLCDLYQHPELYVGKMVKVRGTVAGSDWRLDAFTEKPCPTYMRLIVVLPDHVKPAPGFDLVRDKSFKEFEYAFYRQLRPIHLELTFEGRFDAGFVWRDHERIKVGQGAEKGYGKKYQYDGRIVLHKVSDVQATPVSHK